MSLALRSPELPVQQVWPPQCCVEGREHLPFTCWQHSSQCTPGHQHPPSQQGHGASSHSTSGPPGPPGSLLQSWSVPNIIGFNKQLWSELGDWASFRTPGKIPSCTQLNSRPWWVTQGSFWMLLSLTPWLIHIMLVTHKRKLRGPEAKCEVVVNDGSLIQFLPD